MARNTVKRKPDYACRKCVNEWVKFQEDDLACGFAEYVKKLPHKGARDAMCVSGLRSKCWKGHEKQDSHLCPWKELPFKLKKHVDKLDTDEDPDGPKANRKGAKVKESKAVTEAVAAEKKNTEKTEKTFQKLKANVEENGGWHRRRRFFL